MSSYQWLVKRHVWGSSTDKDVVVFRSHSQAACDYVTDLLTRLSDEGVTYTTRSRN